MGCQKRTYLSLVMLLSFSSTWPYQAFNLFSLIFSCSGFKVVPFFSISFSYSLMLWFLLEVLSSFLFVLLGATLIFFPVATLILWLFQILLFSFFHSYWWFTILLFLSFIHLLFSLLWFYWDLALDSSPFLSSSFIHFPM